MNTFYIARHGETENNRAGLLSGWVDTPLTETGLAATARVIGKLQAINVDVIYSSDLERAFATAKAIGEGIGYGKEIIKLAGLREVNYGDAGGRPVAEAYRLYPELDRNTHYIPPGGESIDQMQARLIQTVLELNGRHTDTAILIVAHSGTMAALRSSQLGIDFGGHNISEAYAHDFLGRFTVEGGKITSFDEVA